MTTGGSGFLMLLRRVGENETRLAYLKVEDFPERLHYRYSFHDIWNDREWVRMREENGGVGLMQALQDELQSGRVKASKLVKSPTGRMTLLDYDLTGVTLDFDCDETVMSGEVIVPKYLRLIPVEPTRREDGTPGIPTRLRERP